MSEIYEVLPAKGIEALKLDAQESVRWHAAWGAPDSRELRLAKGLLNLLSPLRIDTNAYGTIQLVREGYAPVRITLEEIK